MTGFLGGKQEGMGEGGVLFGWGQRVVTFPLYYVCRPFFFIRFEDNLLLYGYVICSMMYSSVAGTADVQRSSGEMHLFSCFRD